MGDSETVLAQTSVTSEYSYEDHTEVSAHVPSDAGGSMNTTENMDHPTTRSTTGDTFFSSETSNAANSVAHGSSVEISNVYIAAPSSMEQETPTSMVYASETNEQFGGHADASLGLTQYAGFDSSLNSNGISEAGTLAKVSIAENVVISADGIGANALHQPMDDSGLSAEEERLWSIVTTNSLDFSAWTSLIEETERMSEGNILKIRKVYDMFLAEFPLCYGYWKKYADHEAQLSSMEKVSEVYERAIQGVTYSVDMWLHYCVFAISTYGEPDTIRGLFERALAYVGTDYLCFPLWDKYIEYEISQQDWPRIAAIYTRVLEIPNQQLDRYFEGFKELVASRPLSEIRTTEDAAVIVSKFEAVGQENEGEVLPSAVEQSPFSASLKDAEELEKYIAVREEIYKKAKELDSKIIGFETAIRRPYFHVRPLNVAELENWHNYLDFIEGGNDFNKVVRLYERCLVACANYPEYWVRYTLCMEASGSMELADNVLARATQVFVKRQPEIHLFAARFKEQHGDISGARAAYQLVHTGISPGLLKAIIKHANMEHRLVNLEDACSLYEQAIAIEKGKEHSQSLPLLFAQYSRFIFLVSGKVDKARKILDRGVEDAQLSKPLLEAMIHLESIQPLPKRIDHLDSLVNKFIVPDPNSPTVASVAEREELSSIFLEFLDLFGDVQSIKKADNWHAKLFLRHKSTVESKKRHADDYLFSDKPKLAKSLISSSAPSAMSAYLNAQNQWPAGYGTQPQASQAQGQQWTPGYAQQAAYGTNGSYGTSYAQPQTPTSVPQSAGYGTYPSTYPAQAFPQQAYAQPAATTALTSGQQPAAVPSATYYSSYY